MHGTLALLYAACLCFGVTVLLGLAEGGADRAIHAVDRSLFIVGLSLMIGALVLEVTARVMERRADALRSE